MIDGSPRFMWNFSWLFGSSEVCLPDSAATQPCRRFHQYTHCVCRCPDACQLFRTVDAVFRPTFVQKLCYKLRRVVTFTFIQTSKFCLLHWTASKLAHLLDTVSKFAIFSMSGLKDKVDKKSKPTWKLKHTNSIPESFEYFCQMSSKLILIILSYTVSKLGHFRHSVHALIIKTNSPIDNYRCLIIVIHLHDKHNSAKTKQGNYFTSMSSLIKRKLYHTSNRFLVSVSKAMFSFYYDKNRNTLVNTWPATDVQRKQLILVTAKIIGKYSW